MKFTFKIKRNEHPKTYFMLEFIGIKFINTHQVWSINITILNVFFQFLYEKKSPTNF